MLNDVNNDSNGEEEYNILTIIYVYGENASDELKGQTAYTTYTAQIKVGDSFNVPSPTIAGYEAQPSTVEGTMESDGLEPVVVVYNPTETSYTVQYLFQNLDGTAYESRSDYPDQTATALTGSRVDVSNYVKSVEGFEINDDVYAANNVVAADGSTVVQIKYDRKMVTISFDSDGGNYISAETRKYGTSIDLTSLDKIPTKEGYTFGGWYQNGKQIDTLTFDADKTLVAKWKINDNQKATYLVSYWIEKANSDDYDFLFSETKEGIAGEKTNVNIDHQTENNINNELSKISLDSKGFDVSNSIIENKEIKLDGSTVVNIPINRKEFTINFYLYIYTPGWFGGSYDWEMQPNLTITAKYGEDIKDIWMDENHSKYTWYTEKNGLTAYTILDSMPARSFNVYGQEAGTGTVITYYIESLNGGYDVYMSANAEDGVHLTDEDKTEIEGFTFYKWKQYTEGWNDHELWLKYTRNSYTINYNLNGGKTSTEINSTTIKF